MNNFANMSFSLVGYGVSNQALAGYFLDRGIDFVVRTPEKVDTPKGVTNIYGNGYLNSYEDIVFRSPVLRPERIRTDGIVTTEIKYALSKAKGIKIGITGSDGKTTVSTLIYEMIKNSGKDALLCGNIGSPLIDKLDRVSEKTHIVCELSSFQLFDHSPYLDVALITNITENHLDWHLTLDEYIQTKLGILKNASRAVIDIDNEYLEKELSNISRDKRLVCVSFEKKDIKRENTDLVYIENGSICYNGEAVLQTDRIKLRAGFNIKNYALAIASSYPYVTREAILKTAEEFTGVCHRMELVCEKNGISFCDSSIDSTPSRTQKTLSAFDKDKVALILGGYDKNLDYSQMKEAVDGVKAVILCGENAPKIYDAIKASKTKIYIEEIFDNAVKKAYSLCQEGDTVLLSPASASFDMFANYKERSKAFLAIAREL
ncbi:MAG: UDP-N-acetylmuramoyl-L-alanine--D-glutamate ligase [Clostridia bacterium]|nr:UDP-N-acetylmuramoyl-L-alanine--D-glutamate ligase [Clostridia bacterium]